MRHFIKYFIISIIAFFFFWFLILRNHRDNRLTKKGNQIIEKIEKFRIENNKLPISLNEIGVFQVESVDEIWYQIIDTTNCYYIVAFGESLDRSKIYFSDSKKWEDSFRDMKNNYDIDK